MTSIDFYFNAADKLQVACRLAAKALAQSRRLLIYAPQPETLAYLEHCAEKYGLLPHCRFGDAVRRARWDESAARWTLELASGRTLCVDVVVSAIVTLPVTSIQPTKLRVASTNTAGTK